MGIQEDFIAAYGQPPRLLAQAPGRVNLLGEHVDYNAGPVLPAAIDRYVQVAASQLESRVVRLQAFDLDKQAEFSLDHLDEKLDLHGRPLPGWALHPAGVAHALQGAGYELRGMQAAFSSNIPIGSGLSSSAAVQVAFAFTWQALEGWQASRMELAQLCQKAENTYVGVASGLMDQFASAHGVEGHALYFDTRSLEWEPLPLPSQTSLVIADSGMRRALAGSAYNQRRAACEQAVAALQKFKPDIRSLRDISPPEFAAYSEYLEPEIAKRAEHVVKEIARVETAVTALRRDDRHAFGALMFAGHASLRDLYEVSIAELDALVRIARQLPGCLGARLTGAGFGGCTVNLVAADQAQPFAEQLGARYLEQTGRQAQVYLCRASAGAAARPL